MDDGGQQNRDYESNSQSKRNGRDYIPSRFSIYNLNRLKNQVEWKHVVAGLLVIILILIITISVVTNHDTKDVEPKPEPEPRDTLGVSWVNYLRTNYSRNALGDAVKVGFDNGFDVFVVRTFHNGEWIPGKLIHHQNRTLDWIHSFFPIDGKEMQIDQFELLVDPRKKLMWVQTTPDTNLEEGGNVVVGGRTLEGEDLYIGRTNETGSSICGKVVPSVHTLYYTWKGKVEPTRIFEILVFRT